ncbi:MAG: hypothetical protein U0N25_00065, partial [Agathobaculum butyriciproducens]
LYRNFLPPEVEKTERHPCAASWPRCVAHVPGFLEFAWQILLKHALPRDRIKLVYYKLSVL